MRTRPLLSIMLAAASALPLFTAQHANSQTVDRSIKPEPGPAPTASFPDFQEMTLPNGLRIFFIPDDRRPTVTLRLLIKSGSLFDGAKPGTASLVASLLNRGSARRTAAEFAQETDFIGAHVESVAGPDAISMSAGALNRYLGQVLDLMADAACQPAFNEEQLGKLRKQTLSALEAQKQQPASLASKMVANLVFGKHPYGAFPTPESVQSIERKDLVEFHSAHFTPANASIAVVGDVSAKEVFTLIEKSFGAWKGGATRQPARPAPQFPAPKGLSIHLVDRPGSVQSNIQVCTPAPPRAVPELPEMLVLNATLGGGFSGRLFQNLRETHGWTYGSYSSFDLRRDAGVFTASAETRNAVTAPAITEILKEIARIREQQVPEPELKLQREYNVGNYLLSLEKNERTAQRVQDIDLYGLPKDFYRNYASRMASVSSGALQKIAGERLSSTDAFVVVVGAASEIKESLEAIGPVTVYDTDLRPKK